MLITFTGSLSPLLKGGGVSVFCFRDCDCYDMSMVDDISVTAIKCVWQSFLIKKFVLAAVNCAID